MYFAARCQSQLVNRRERTSGMYSLHVQLEHSQSTVSVDRTGLETFIDEGSARSHSQLQLSDEASHRSSRIKAKRIRRLRYYASHKLE